MIFSKRHGREMKLLETLGHFTQDLCSIANFKDLLKNILRSLVEIADTRNGNILLLEKEIKSFVVRESFGGDPLVLQFSSHDPFINYLGQTGRYLTEHQILADARLIDIKEPALHFMTSVGAYLAFPMIVDKQFIGILTLGAKNEGQNYREEQMELLQVLITMGSISIANGMLYDSLAKQNLKLSEIAKLKTQFVSTISHELSTPLNGIIGLTEVLLNPETSGPLTDDQRRYVQMIQSAGEELAEVVNQILDLTRFQSQKGVLEVKRVDLFKTLDGLKGDFEDIFCEKGFRLKMELAPKTNVYGDEGQIRQVFRSLFENAVKFSQGKPSGVIGIQASRHGDMLKICVSDHGIGIDEKDQEIIFDEFRQADGEHTRSYGGTGLGLALAKKIVEMHGGRIWVESKKGEGAQFYFTLPLKPGLVQVTELENPRG